MNDSDHLQVLFPALRFDVVTIAASAGGIQALGKLLSCLPNDFAAAIFIVLHIHAKTKSLLPQVLNKTTSLIIKDAVDGDDIRAGTIYTAPPDYHLLVNEAGHLQLTHTATVNYARPAADCTFESVAQRFGQRAIAVILTGYGKDGAQGVQTIKQQGGRVIVQDPATAAIAAMPRAAIATGQVDWVLPVEKIAAALVKLLHNDEI